MKKKKMKGGNSDDIDDDSSEGVIDSLELARLRAKYEKNLKYKKRVSNPKSNKDNVKEEKRQRIRRGFDVAQRHETHRNFAKRAGTIALRARANANSPPSRDWIEKPSSLKKRKKDF